MKVKTENDVSSLDSSGMRCWRVLILLQARIRQLELSRVRPWQEAITSLPTTSSTKWNGKILPCMAFLPQ